LKPTHSRFSTAFIRLAILVLTTCSITTAQAVTFLGVAAGDATSNSVTLWARAQQSGLQTGVGIMGLVSPDPAFSSDVMLTTGVPDPAHDFTIHFNVTRLKSGTRYYYRFPSMTESGRAR
jgi:phosphodiesterase/alkaline phosphatase D-like protein